VGKLTIKIPWSQLRSQPVVITLDQLFILAGPTPESTYDAATQAALEAKLKLEALLNSELSRLVSPHLLPVLDEPHFTYTALQSPSRLRKKVKATSLLGALHSSIK
jgi:hypothetical protein